MEGKSLEEITRMVTESVRDRLGRADGDVMEVVVREGVSAMSGQAAVPPPSTPPPPRPAAGAQQAGEEGSVTTPRGATLPAAPDAGSLELCASCMEQQRRREGNRAVVTTTGRNRKGVLAAMAALVAEAGGDIQDVSQTIVADFFTMIMVVDTSELSLSFADFKERLVSTSAGEGIHTVVMHENVLSALQRV
jgi:ACT domain-containing protein